MIFLRVLFLFVILLLPFKCYSFDHSNWKMHNTILQSAVVMTQLADWSQTRQFVNNEPGDGRVYEKVNPFLRKNPGAVDIYFPSVIIGSAIISYILPEPYRTIWQAENIIIESIMIERNRSLGIRIRF